MELDKKLKAKWLRALRSGKFKQGRASLKMNDGQTTRYCCLGVLCEVGKIRSQSDCYIRGGIDFGYDVLPAGVQKKLGSMNDDGKRFPTIANWIEKNL